MENVKTYLSAINNKAKKLPPTNHLIECCHLHGFPILITFTMLFDAQVFSFCDSTAMWHMTHSK